MRTSRTPAAFDAIVGLAATLPWWGGLAAAAAFFFALRPFAHVVAWVQVAQYALPAVCVLIAGLSAYGRHVHRQVIHKATGGTEAPSPLNAMPWNEIEPVIGEAFRAQGYAVSEAAAKRGTRQAEIVLHKSGQTFICDCRYWRSAVVDAQEVMDAFGDIQQRAAGGFIVTTGRFAPEARDFAYGKWLHLVDGPQVREMVRAAQAAHDPSLAPWEPGADDPGSSWFAPECPVCRSSMVLRIAERGPNAGRKYWGCSHAPLCKGTRDAT